MSISETERRRRIQEDYNRERGIDPQTIRKKVTDILLSLEAEGRRGAVPEKRRRKRFTGEGLPRDELERLIRSLEDEMHEAAKDLRFEYAARLRDEVQELRRELAAMREAGVR